MSIEKNIERIANALELIAAAHTSEMKFTPVESDSSTKKEKKKSSPKKTTGSASESKDDSQVSKDAVREALKALQKAQGAAAARELLGEHGAKTLTDLKPEVYSNVIEAAEEAARD